MVVFDRFHCIIFYHNLMHQYNALHSNEPVFYDHRSLTINITGTKRRSKMQASQHHRRKQQLHSISDRESAQHQNVRIWQCGNKNHPVTDPLFRTLDGSAHGFQSQGGFITACTLLSLACTSPEPSLVARSGHRTWIARLWDMHNAIAHFLDQS